ncbi:MAG: hypothetical protein HS129_15045 [Leptospiraceae bacterium]|nr:hypothetical protein [Leptospiraceae bacterium]
MNPIIASNETLKSAFDKLPQPYADINDDFLEQHKESIGVLKKEFENRGGIHLITTGDKKVIVRLPSRALLDDVLERAKKQKQSDSMQFLVGSCLLYPSIDVVQSWVDKEAPGLYIPLGNKIAELSAVTQETSAKKL